MFSEFDARTQANMELALQLACGELADDRSDQHEVRRFIAARLIEAVLAGKTDFSNLMSAARNAAGETTKKRVE